MPETLYALGKAESLEGDAAAAEKSWTELLTIEKERELAAQTHFASEAEREMKEFQKLRTPASSPIKAAFYA